MLDHLRRFLAVALFAGVLSGGVAAIGHQIGTVPLIVAAEAYEGGTGAPAGDPSHDHAHGAAPHAHDHAAEAWMPEDGLERTAYTLLADVLTGIAYALLLTALLVLARRRPGWREGLFWGLAGFVAFGIAPAVGLPPGLPGAPVAPTLDRQVWWIATAALTAGGIALMLLGRRPALALLGIALIVLPQILGAPPAPAEVSPVPAWLAQRFVGQVAVVGLLSWATLGLATGWMLGRLERRTA